MADRLGDRGPRLVVTAGVAPIGIGATETARTAAVTALAPDTLRGSAFGLLATVQAGGNVVASTIAGLLYTLTTPTVGFFYVTAWMLIALAGPAFIGHRRTT